MPEMDGPSAVRELPTYPEMAKVPILAVTAASDPAELREARQAGYNDCLGKADRAALVDKVRQWLLDSP
jgi:CheY-like chemotaxis protein